MNSELVKGYIVENWANNTEALYAVKVDGSIYTRTAKLMCDDFNVHNAKWTSVKTLPAIAEFIGNYPTPKQIN